MPAFSGEAGEGRQELTKKNETLDSLDPSPLPQADSRPLPPPPSCFPPNLHQTALTPGLEPELVFLVVASNKTLTEIPREESMLGGPEVLGGPGVWPEGVERVGVLL